MPRVVRVIAMRSGRMIDDRLLEIGATYSVGTAPQNTLRLTGIGLPESVTLLQHDGAQVVLHAVEQLRGEIALDGVTPTALSGTNATLVLPLPARGWVALGDVTLCLQPAPEAAPKPKGMLPPEVRGGWLSGIESRFALVLGGVVALEGIGVAAISRRPVMEPEFVEPGNAPPPFIVPMIEEPPPKAGPERRRERPQSGRTVSTAKAPSATETAHQAVLDLFGGGDADGALKKVIDDRRELVEIEAALEKTVPRLASLEDLHRRERNADPIGPVDVDPMPNDPMPPQKPIALPPKEPPTPKVDWDPLPQPVDPPRGFDPDEIARFIKRHMGAIKGCYERELKSDPTLRGKVSLRVTISPQGRFSEIEVEQNSMPTDAVGACIVRQMRTWTLQSRPEEDVTVSFPLVFAPGG